MPLRKQPFTFKNFISSLFTNMKTKLVFLLIYILIIGGMIDFSKSIKDETVALIQQQIIIDAKKIFDTLLQVKYDDAETFFSIVNEDDKVQDLLSKALTTDNPKNLKTLQKALYNHLTPLYQLMIAEGTYDLHFALHHNDLFLSMKDGIVANKHIQTFIPNDDHIMSGYQLDDGVYVYSLIFTIQDKSNNALGTYHTVFSIDHLIELLKTIDNINTQAIYSTKQLIDGWESQYDHIEKMMQNNQAFSIYKKQNLQEADVLTFLPLNEIGTGKTIAFLAMNTQSSHIADILKQYETRNIAFALVLAVVLVLLYLIFNHAERIHNERQRFKLAIESSNDGIWDYLVNEQTLYLSPKWFEIHGYDVDKSVKNLEDMKRFIHPEDQHIFIEAYTAMFDTQNDILDCKYRIYHSSGEWRWIHNRAKAHFNKHGNPIRVVGFYDDITQSKLHEEQQEQMIKNLEAAANAKSDFLANMSHEIRTPMNAILGFVEILMIKESDEKKLKTLKIINESGKSLIKIINDILDFSKIGSHMMSIEENNYNLPDTLYHVQQLFNSVAQEKEIDLQLTIDPSLPNDVVGDKVRVEQILSNIISNAIKFSQAGGKVTIQVIYDEKLATARFEVIDEGVGISNDKVNTIFDAFSQEDNSTTRRFGGTGLGLSISKKLCELMGGSIGVESEVGIGSTFFFTLPIQKSAT
jgi:PAS domain S-box-containing protein